MPPDPTIGLAYGICNKGMDVSQAPKTDYELLGRWEWFRRSAWGEDAHSRELCRAFTTLVKEAGAQVCLEADCGFAGNAQLLHKQGVNILGCDESAFLIQRAREYMQSTGESVSLFVAASEDIATQAPHPFDAIFCPALLQEPEWAALRNKFQSIQKALRPGGFVAFTGPVQGGSWTGLLEDYDNAPSEEALWTFREGGIGCTKLIVRGNREKDYADERILHVIDEHGSTRIEATGRRLPAYWNWSILSDLVRQSGLSHVETRRFPGEGGRGVVLNVAWKSGSLKDGAESHPEANAYADR